MNTSQSTKLHSSSFACFRLATVSGNCFTVNCSTCNTCDMRHAARWTRHSYAAWPGPAADHCTSPIAHRPRNPLTEQELCCLCRRQRVACKWISFSAAAVLIALLLFRLAPAVIYNMGVGVVEGEGASIVIAKLNAAQNWAQTVPASWTSIEFGLSN